MEVLWSIAVRLNGGIVGLFCIMPICVRLLAEFAAFCIGSEMRGLTQIRGAGGSFPAVAALQVLAAEVREILGPDCKISYAADWSEYHGYQPTGTADKLFHLDPLLGRPAHRFHRD